jgi:hypothetical protein
MTKDILYVIANLVAIAAGFALFYYGYRSYRVDLLRQKLFVLRDQLFDYAATGAVAFEEPAYITTRRMLNGMIRFAHRVSLPHVLFMTMTRRYWSVSDEADQHWKLYKQSVNALPQDVRHKLNHSMFEANMMIAAHVVHICSLTFPLVMLLKAVWSVPPLRTLIVARMEKKLSTKVARSRMKDVVDREAYLCGA